MKNERPMELTVQVSGNNSKESKKGRREVKGKVRRQKDARCSTVHVNGTPRAVQCSDPVKELQNSGDTEGLSQDKRTTGTEVPEKDSGSRRARCSKLRLCEDATGT